MSRPEARTAANLPTRAGWPALLVLLLALALPAAGLAIWFAPAGDASPLLAPIAAQGPSEPEAFSHNRHVNRYWWRSEVGAEDTHRTQHPELAQDCRGCHDYSLGEHDSSLSVDLCQRCHVVGPREFEVRRVDTERPGSGFPHSRHLALECRTCHGPDLSSGRDVPAVLPIPEMTGIEYCRSCHVADGTRSFFFGISAQGQTEAGPAPRTADEMRRKLVARIDGLEVDRLAAPFQPQAGPVGDRVLGRFRHSTHLSAAEVAPSGQSTNSADSAACATCHPRLDRPAGSDAAANRNLAAVPFDAAACSSCHGPNVRFEPRTVGRRSLTAGTFPHHLHVGAAQNGVELSCTGCHQFDGGMDRFGLAPSWGGDAYASCVQCHTDREVSNHGGSWNCAECHGVQSFDQSQSFSLGAARPRVDVLRPDAGEFHFAQHGHLGLGTDSSCADCHRAEPGQGPSSLADRAFEHSTHLAPDTLATLNRWSAANGAEREAAAAQCARCHSDVANLAAPADWSDAHAGNSAATFHPTRDHVFAAAECADCHGREPAVAAADLRSASRLVFSHRDHVGRTLPGQGELTCLDCHRPNTHDGPQFALARGVADCTDCHGHGAHTKVPRPLGFTAADGQACQSCHSAGIPSDTRPVEVGRQVVARQVGTLSHPTEASADCSQCHQSGAFAESAATAAAPAGRRTQRAQDRVWTVTGPDPTTSPHAAKYHADREQLGLGSVNAYFQADPANDQGLTCMRCHWADNEKQTRRGALYQLGHDSEMRRRVGLPLLESWTAGITVRGAKPSASER